ncbi:F-box domain-containing protein [Mycena venus]|uniref:F-box domain-containing protein n=1 Tax=Mycena venus TaxID=2733690 RepID=A0A8H6XTH2_9AGAR|nr:F-box domain-containing protein [Mycena venus]
MVASICSQCGADASAPAEKRRYFEVAPGTPHHRLLNSNDAPLDSDVTFVKSEIAKIDDRLAYLDGRAARLREQLQQVEEEHASLSSYREKNCTILSPLRRMPSEVLSEIFSCTLPSVSAAENCQIQESPWVLTHISRRWRAITVSNHSLWSHIDIIYPPDTDPASLYPLSMVETQISRAQKLTVHFRGCETTDSRPQIEMFQCLAKHSSQWDELYLLLTSAIFSLLPSFQDRIPMLRRLQIEWDTEESQEAAESIDCFQTASSLVNISVRNRFRSIPVLAPLLQLVHYDVDATWEMHSEFLKISQNLVVARICVDFDEDDQWLDSEVVVLPCLRQELAIDTDEEDHRILEYLEPAVARSSCPLHRLCFKDCPNADTVRQILERFPSVIDLAIITRTWIDSMVAEELIHILTVSWSEPFEVKIVAPQLRNISFGFPHGSYVKDSIYIEMLKSCWNSNNCALQSSALLVAFGATNLGTDADIGVLREEGLDLLLLEGEDASRVMDTWLFYSTCSCF